MRKAQKGRATILCMLSILIVLSLSACNSDLSVPFFSGAQEFSVSNKAQEKYLRDALEIFHSPELKKSGYYPVQRMLAARRISTILIENGQEARAARFLSSLSDEHDAYEAWYLFAAGAVYESINSGPIARLFYERILNTLPDMTIEGQSIHRTCLAKLLESDSPPAKKIGWYRDFIRRFPDADEVGPFHFLLAKEYEKLGLWSQAIEEYRKFLPYFGVSVPGYSDAHDYARKMVEFNDSPKTGHTRTSTTL